MKRSSPSVTSAIPTTAPASKLIPTPAPDASPTTGPSEVGRGGVRTPDAAKPPVSREWTDATGKFRVQATLIEAKDGKVVLKRDKDGEQITVPIGNRSNADLEFVDQAGARQ